MGFSKDLKTKEMKFEKEKKVQKKCISFEKQGTFKRDFRCHFWMSLWLKSLRKLKIPA